MLSHHKMMVMPNKKKIIYTVAMLTLGALIFLCWPQRLLLEDKPFCTVLEDEHGELLAAQIAQDGQWRFPMMDSLPEKFIDCILTYEDKRFYSHVGIDFLSTARAIHQNIRERRVVSGASTITMQIMRMSMGHNDRSISNKLIEMLAAVRLDFKRSKSEIINIYASHAPFGGNVVGLEAAAWKYFDKNPYQLSWAEMATLSVLPNAPSLITFTKNRDQLIKKRNILLNSLRDRDIIDDIELEPSLSEPLATGLYELSHDASHYMHFLKSQSHTGRLQSSVDRSLQVALNKILDRHYDVLSQNDIHNGAILVIDNKTLDVKAYCANVPKTSEERNVDMILAQRSSGSILKPLLYAAMIDGGHLAPDALVRDVPIYMSRFTPTNYNGQFKGLVPASEALSKSLNVPFVVLLQEYGVEKFRRQLEQIGLRTVNKSGNAHYGLSLILGGAEVRLYDLVHAYAAMARTLSGEQDFMWDKGSIYHTLEAMKKLERPDDRGNWQLFNSSQQLAWKTGTSYGHRDAWSIGVTPQYTIGVWVGNSDGEGRDQIIGSSTAGKILFDVMEALPADNHWFDTPYEEVTWMQTCRTTGMLPSIHCDRVDTTLISQSVLKSGTCHYHKTISTEPEGQWQVNNSCYSGDIIKKSILQLSAREAQYYLPSHPDIVVDVPWHPDCADPPVAGAMQIVYPNSSEHIYIPRDLNAQRQKIIAEVAHIDKDSKVYWYVDDHYQGKTESFHSIEIDLPAGKHTLFCVDELGEESAVSFQVISK